MDETRKQNSFSFLSADERREDALTELIETRVKPAVKGLLRRKFFVSMSSGDDGRDNQDALDVMGDVISTVLPKLRRTADDRSIENLDAYVRTVTLNAYHQYLRKKYPQRLRITNQLRYLLTHRDDLALWESGVWLCGPPKWKTEEALPAGADEVDAVRDEAKNTNIGSKSLPNLVVSIFTIAKRPLAFTDLVSIVLTVSGIIETEHQELSSSVSSGEDLAADFEQRDLLKRLWEDVLQLPLRHRCALLLNLHNSRGEGLISLLPTTRVASIRRIASALEFEPEEFARIWNELPWDDNRIAAHLRITRQQVINLRQSARAALKRRLKK
jgi:hypothetical protein